MDKKTIRKEMSDRKKQLTEEEVNSRSEVLARKLFDMDEYRNADTVLVYLSINQEVRTQPIIERAISDGKKVAVPRVISEDENGIRMPLKDQIMDFIYIDSSSDLREHNGILEPEDGEVADADALVVVPGLAFGRDMTRIGYGGGFYDRYFNMHSYRNFIKVALCYDFQLFDSLPTSELDIKMDHIIVS